MDAAQGLEFFLLETLDADRQAIDPQGAVGDEFLLLEGPRIGFQGDFDVAGERDALFHTCKQTAEGRGTEQARGATAEEDRTQLPAVHRVQVLVEVGQQGIDVLLFW
ncbi:hypothetical protein D3C72_2161580 [compost metagenome]